MHAVGRHAEEIAARFLRACGYTILARNSRRGGAEIDILCRHQAGRGVFIFEVKTRQADRHVSFPGISPAQVARLRDAALELQASADTMLDIRLVLLSVEPAHERVEVIPFDG